MKNVGYVLVLAAILLMSSCSSTKKVQETNVVLDELIAQKAFEFEVRAAFPFMTNAMNQVLQGGALTPPGSTGNRIDVMGSGYYLRILGDSVSARLPYYGERQMGGGYNNDTGINFDDTIEDLVISQDSITKSYLIKFNLNKGNEGVQVIGNIGRKESGEFSISSSHRTNIRYTGVLREIETEEP